MKTTAATYIALISAVALLLLIAGILAVQGLPLLNVGLTSLVCFLVMYLLVHWLVNRFVGERLKTVYRVLNANEPQQASHQAGADVLERAEGLIDQWQQRQQNNEFERLRNNDLYRKEFVANVTHELKTPLFNIQGYVHSLLDGALEDREVNRMFLEKASRNVDRLATLVSDLETITELETGSVLFEPEVFELNALVVDVMEALEAKSKQRQHPLVKTGKQPVYVFADKERIRQVLINLVENSIKYGNENGTTTINVLQDDANALVEIADDGPGISAEHLSRLFERFYRVDRSRSREAGGTGLGLAIVKHILEKHGKTIAVQSEVGKGTTFRFALDKR